MSRSLAPEGIFAGVGCLFVSLWVSIITAMYVGLVFWTDRNLDFWLSYSKGYAFDAPLWISVLLSLFGPVDFFVNLISEVARLFVS